MKEKIYGEKIFHNDIVFEGKVKFKGNVVASNGGSITGGNGSGSGSGCNCETSIVSKVVDVTKLPEDPQSDTLYRINNKLYKYVKDRYYSVPNYVVNTQYTALTPQINELLDCFNYIETDTEIGINDVYLTLQEEDNTLVDIWTYSDSYIINDEEWMSVIALEKSEYAGDTFNDELNAYFPEYGDILARYKLVASFSDDNDTEIPDRLEWALFDIDGEFIKFEEPTVSINKNFSDLVDFNMDFNYGMATKEDVTLLCTKLLKTLFGFEMLELKEPLYMEDGAKMYKHCINNIGYASSGEFIFFSDTNYFESNSINVYDLSQEEGFPLDETIVKLPYAFVCGIDLAPNITTGGKTPIMSYFDNTLVAYNSYDVEKFYMNIYAAIQEGALDKYLIDPSNPYLNYEVILELKPSANEDQQDTRPSYLGIKLSNGFKYCEIYDDGSYGGSHHDSTVQYISAISYSVYENLVTSSDIKYIEPYKKLETYKSGLKVELDINKWLDHMDEVIPGFSTTPIISEHVTLQSTSTHISFPLFEVPVQDSANYYTEQVGQYDPVNEFIETNGFYLAYDSLWFGPGRYEEATILAADVSATGLTFRDVANLTGGKLAYCTPIETSVPSNFGLILQGIMASHNTELHGGTSEIYDLLEEYWYNNGRKDIIVPNDFITFTPAELSILPAGTVLEFDLHKLLNGINAYCKNFSNEIPEDFSVGDFTLRYGYDESMLWSEMYYPLVNPFNINSDLCIKRTGEGNIYVLGNQVDISRYEDKYIDEVGGITLKDVIDATDGVIRYTLPTDTPIQQFGFMNILSKRFSECNRWELPYETIFTEFAYESPNIILDDFYTIIK